MTARFHINLFWSGPDGAWVADVPDLRSCSAFGDSPAEALAEVEKAMEAWLAVAREDGLPIPEPRYHGTKPAASGVPLARLTPINDHWRICFVWNEGDAERVEIVDYH